MRRILDVAVYVQNGLLCVVELGVRHDGQRFVQRIHRVLVEYFAV